jgi:hypothetical protein
VAGDAPLPPLRAGWINERLSHGTAVTQRACAQRGEITPEMEFAAIRESGLLLGLPGQPGSGAGAAAETRVRAGPGVLARAGSVFARSPEAYCEVSWN